MPSAARSLLQAVPGNFPAAAAGGPREPLALDSDVMVILAALLCALICVVGLALAARCSCLRRYATPSSPAPNKGLKKKVIRALPRQAFAAGPATEKLADCPICLAEFADGDEIRILPHCGHGFHVGCVDTWLGAHSSCPSCRRILVAAPSPKAAAATSSLSSSCCRHCGASSASSPTAVTMTAAEAGVKAREDSNGDRFLP